MRGPAAQYKEGDKVNNYTIKQPLDVRNKERYYQVFCICGKELDLSSRQLRKKISCGCVKKKAWISSKIIGKTINDITIVKRLDKRGRNYYYEYKCICGKKGEVKSDKIHLKKSCGCHRKFTYEDVTNEYMSSLKGGAKSRNIEVYITQKDIWEQYLKQGKICALSGQSISFKRSKGIQQTASVDRIDSQKAYTVDNIQIVHRNINIMKMHFSQEEFIKNCVLISNFKGKEYEKDR